MQEPSPSGLAGLPQALSDRDFAELQNLIERTQQQLERLRGGLPSLDQLTGLQQLLQQLIETTTHNGLSGSAAAAGAIQTRLNALLKADKAEAATGWPLFCAETESLLQALSARLSIDVDYGVMQRRMQKLQQLRDQEHQALNHHAIVSIADPTGTITYVNDKFCEVSGYTREELIGNNHRQVKSGLHADSFYRDLWRTIAAGQVWQGEICNRRKDGELYWVESTIMPFLDSRGCPYQYVSLRTDITRTKQAEQALLSNSGLLSATLESTRDAILAAQSDGTVIVINRQFRQLWGIPESLDIDSIREADMIDSLRLKLASQLKDPDAFLQKINDLYQSRNSSSDLLEFNDGRTIERHSQPLLQEGQVIGRVWSFHDLTDRVQAEQRAETARERLRSGQLFANIGTWEWDLMTGELFWTERIAPLFGYPEGELTTSYDNFIKAVHPHDREAVQQGINACIQEDAPYEIEHRVVWPDGSTRWLLERGACVRDESGRPLRMLGVVQDIDERKRTEQELIQTRDLAEKANRAKSDFLSSMSHELRTPMNAILGFSQLMQFDTSLSAEHQDYVHEIIRAGNHLLELINEVLDLAKIEAGKIDMSLEPVNLDDTIGDCLSLTRILAERKKVQLHCPANTDLYVRADKTRLKQALVNLLSNAVKYNREGGSVQLQIEQPDANRVQIHVRDTGRGIAPERLEELFQPFQRLGAEFEDIEGTGIGLSITRRIIELMGGAIRVSSEPGRGSDFWIELPREDVGNASADPHWQRDTPFYDSRHLGGFTLLYVEDNPANIKLVARIIARLRGVNLLTAHTPELGLELARAQQPDLIVLDINMPGMDGYQVLRTLQSETALRATPVIALTANAMPRDIEKGRQAGFWDYLTKPIDVNAFLERINQLLLNKTRGTADDH